MSRIAQFVVVRSSCMRSVRRKSLSLWMPTDLEFRLNADWLVLPDRDLALVSISALNRAGPDLSVRGQSEEFACKVLQSGVNRAGKGPSVLCFKSSRKLCIVRDRCLP